MKFAYSQIDRVFELGKALIPTLVIENQGLFRGLLKDLHLSLNGVPTLAILSQNDTPIDFAKYAEIINDFVSFNINQKPLITKICTALEHIAISPEHYLDTQRLLSELESKISEWAFNFPCDIITQKVSVSNIIKAVGVAINDDYEGENGDAERIIDYMELVREFDRDKLFVTVNMRSYFSDEIILKFMQTAISHEYKVLMIEAKDHPLLNLEKRLTVDADLCEF